MALSIFLTHCIPWPDWAVTWFEILPTGWVTPAWQAAAEDTFNAYDPAIDGCSSAHAAALHAEPAR